MRFFPLRLLRLFAKLIAGLFTSTTTLKRASPEARRETIETWSKALLKIAGIREVAIGFPAQSNRAVTLVANHVSWADIFALNAQRACHFVAKAELRSWPIAGKLLDNVGTIFINRSDRKETHRLASVVHALMEQGETVAVFPEGTTSDGSNVLKFHASLLEPVVAAGGEVWVVAIRYLANGEPTQAAAYIGEMTLLQSLQQIHAAAPLTVELRFLKSINCAGRTRRDVAAEAETLIRASIVGDSLNA